MADILANLQSVYRRIKEAEVRSGRQPGSVRLVAVTKTVPLDKISVAVNAGVVDLGENRVQELTEKADNFTQVKWHMIGHLQTNKVKYIIDKVFMIHSLDRWSLAETISKQAVKKGVAPNLLVQVNISGEESKHGLAPAEVEDFIIDASRLPNVNIKGLMTMAPLVANPEDTRWIFRKLRLMRERLQEKWPHIQLLSMGMTNDFEVAVEEGADLVRIGSAIFRA